MKFTEADATQALDYLKYKALELGISELINEFFTPTVIGCRFPIWSGSSKPNQHHYGKHGLVIHTTEVVKLCLANRELLQVNIDERQIFLAAIYHDVGKMWDYSPTDSTHEEWTGNLHKRKIHHISRSALVWQRVAETKGKKDYLTEEFADDVLHSILAHHGLREWGSPVMPYTKLAWLLHLCDGISARMNDADTRDAVKPM